MNTGPLIAEIAALVGDPARAAMLKALLDGHALSATELAYAARITAHEYIVPSEGAAEITTAGTCFLAEFGIDVSSLKSARRELCGRCLDWTERRAHIAGALGAALTQRCFDLGWIERMKRSSAVIVTPPGQSGFLQFLGSA